MVIAVGLLAVLAGGVWLARGSRAARPAVEGPRTARIERGDLIASVSATGTLQPYAQVEVRSRATGTVVDLRVQEGDRVSAGQVLAVIDDRDARAGYETSQAQLAAARARLEQARSQLAATRAQNTVRVAQAERALATARARLAQVLAGARAEQIDQARQALRQAELAADLARQTLERTRALFTDGLVSRSQLDQAQNQHDVAQAQVASARARLRELEAGSRPEEVAIARAQVAEAEAALQQARAARLQEGVLAADVTAADAQVRNARAQLAQARDRLDETRIVAPIAGVVARLPVQVGQSVIGGLTGGGTLIMTIADTRVVQAFVNVDESDIAQIREGMTARITADALPGRTLAGTVTRIAPQSVVVQNVTQYTVVVDVRNPDRLLRLGMTVDAEFIIVERRGVLLVPAEAIRGKDARVLILLEGETLTPVVVETGATDGRQVEIVRGLGREITAGQPVYLGPARQPSGAGARPQQPVNPFLPQFPRRTTPIRPGP
ncbi:MAG: efflux RND transporter periplasmic adaptor subunit [Armatimonadota bacterium]|nr:efflux RND transporter periplasmic adaptor subunit [Armatimonadota bacterium]MDR7549141.1 efflux RND transporter periplasmic adaptor subunit [Armatimonadota bacterium]